MFKFFRQNKRYVVSAAILLAAGIAYLIFVRLTGLAIPCVFRLVTGFKCPGCGITTMCIHTSKLQFRSAFWDNIFLFVTWPYIIFAIIYSFFCKRVKKKNPAKSFSISLYLYIVLLIIWGVVRNIIHM